MSCDRATNPRNMIGAFLHTNTLTQNCSFRGKINNRSESSGYLYGANIKKQITPLMNTGAGANIAFYNANFDTGKYVAEIDPILEVLPDCIPEEYLSDPTILTRVIIPNNMALKNLLVAKNYNLPGNALYVLSSGNYNIENTIHLS